VPLNFIFSVISSGAKRGHYIVLASGIKYAQIACPGTKTTSRFSSGVDFISEKRYRN
jgi:hypothetical protein